MPTRVPRIARAVPILLLPLLAACSESRPLVTDSSPASLPAKAASRDIYQAALVWDDVVTAGPAGIRGDGRNRFGQAGAPANEYQGKHCGVWTRLNSYGTAGVEFDSDTYYDAATMSGNCGAARKMSLFLDGLDADPAILSPHFETLALWAFGAGETRLQVARFGLQNGTCVLEFNSAWAGADMARVTRLPDVSGARQWRVESQGNHRAACTRVTKGKAVDTGVRYVLPFAVTITQVLEPAPSYP